ncbi:MAG: sulfatase [Candidatus Glassbacteria bacterium]
MVRVNFDRPRMFILFFLISLVSVGCSCGVFTKKRPNVIILVVDTLRADHLGCYGYHRNTSPNLDRLAERSVLFMDVTSQAPWTNPSIASLFTSLYPSAHHLLTLREGDNLRTLDEDIITLAEVMKSNGFATAAYTANPWLSAGSGIESGFDTYKNLPGSTTASQMNEMAMEWIRKNRGEKPFFLYIHYMDVHGPYTPPPPYDNLFSLIDSSRRELSKEEMIRMPRYLRIEGLTTLDEYGRRYDGGIRYWDECLATFLEELGVESVLQNSILIVTADHGEEFLEHGGFNHGSTLFQEQIRVPLIWWIPSTTTSVQKIREPVELVDVMPTLLSLLGLKRPEVLQGDDVSPLLSRDTFTPSPVFSEATVGFGGIPLPEGTMKSVRIGRLKAIMNLDTGEVSLYDLSSDPGERMDSSGGRDRETNALLKELRDWMETNALIGGRYESGQQSLSQDVRERLKALGYIDR